MDTLLLIPALDALCAGKSAFFADFAEEPDFADDSDVADGSVFAFASAAVESLLRSFFGNDLILPEMGLLWGEEGRGPSM